MRHLQKKVEPHRARITVMNMTPGALTHTHTRFALHIIGKLAQCYTAYSQYNLYSLRSGRGDHL